MMVYHRAQYPNPNKGNCRSTSEASSQTKLGLQIVQRSPIKSEASEDGAHASICVLAEKLFHLVRKLQEEVSRQFSLRENEKEIDMILTEALQRREPKLPAA